MRYLNPTCIQLDMNLNPRLTWLINPTFRRYITLVPQLFFAAKWYLMLRFYNVLVFPLLKVKGHADVASLTIPPGFSHHFFISLSFFIAHSLYFSLKKHSFSFISSPHQLIFPIISPRPVTFITHHHFHKSNSRFLHYQTHHS